MRDERQGNNNCKKPKGGDRKKAIMYRNVYSTDTYPPMNSYY